MSYIAKPRIRLPKLEANGLGLTRQDYEGAMSTLCAGCGHDSVTAAIIDTFFQLDIPPHRVAKLSGIGCSAKTPTYFLGTAHGFNGVHGRMPALATGAQAAHPGLTYIGISGDGDSLSIGLGQLCHAIRRNVDMLYVLENNGVYGLTKGQFSASADVGSKSKRGEPNRQTPIDPVFLALSLGATFVARSFSGDKAQLVPILKAAIRHKGFALVDVISPCVTFNDHEASTKSYRYTREQNRPVVEADFVPLRAAIAADYGEGEVREVAMHDGGVVRFRKVPDGFDPRDRDSVYRYLRDRQRAGEVATGLLFVEPDAGDMHDVLGTVAEPLVDLPFEALNPGAAALDDLMDTFR
ncbi:MAG: 2-oxoacid:ferredoxin oxidoreductase subunit beta [Gemmatimonadota bacterium]|jgi:2-oxoglutarate ferredoxin oxidoreductase subunit beta